MAISETISKTISPTGGVRSSPTMVAIEAVLLWPRRPAKTSITDSGAGVWPLLAIVVNGQLPAGDAAVRRLFDVLHAGQRTGRITMLRGTSAWSVRDGQNPLLKLAVRTEAPSRLDVDILLPVRPLRHVLATLSRGATVAITTRRQADRLTAGVSARDALRGLTLVTCPPSTELAALAEADGGARS